MVDYGQVKIAESLGEIYKNSKPFLASLNSLEELSLETLFFGALFFNENLKKKLIDVKEYIVDKYL